MEQIFEAKNLGGVVITPPLVARGLSIISDKNSNYDKHLFTNITYITTERVRTALRSIKELGGTTIVSGQTSVVYICVMAMQFLKL